jgi:hypothetical protein
MSANRARGCGLLVSCLFACTLQGCGAADAPGRDTTSRSGPTSVPRAPVGAGGAAARGFGSGPVDLAGFAAPTIPSNPSGPAANGGSDVCASALVQAIRNMPTIMFVIDGSGSMCAPFGNSTRWQALRTALLDPMKGLIYRLQSSVSFGATLYDGTIDLTLALSQPGGGGGGNANQNPGCALNYAGMKDMGMCPQLVEVLPPRLNNAMAIDTAYPKTELGGSTPTDKALSHVMDGLLAMVQQQGPDQKAMSPVYVILATDGAPNDICVGGTGGDGSAQRQGVVAAVDRGAAAGIKTWVVSLAGGDAMLQAHLDEVAKHGDPTNASARTFNPTNPDDLIMTLAQLLGGAVGCHVNLNGTVAVGQECAGAVQYNGRTLPCCEKAGNGWNCDQRPATPPNGWRLSDDHSIELVGDACTSFLLGSDELLMATFPCEVFRPG